MSKHLFHLRHKIGISTRGIGLTFSSGVNHFKCAWQGTSYVLMRTLAVLEQASGVIWGMNL